MGTLVYKNNSLSLVMEMQLSKHIVCQIIQHLNHHHFD